jgi:hypothetical protein
MRGICQSSRAYNGHHEPYIAGTPRSAMTWYVCSLCGAREPRGQGAFYGVPTWEATTLEQRIKKLEDTIKSPNAALRGGEAVKQAKKDALMEAAQKFEGEMLFPSDELRRMAEEI